MTIQYLTGATGPYLETGIAHERNIGLLIQPGNSYHKRVHLYPAWAADNGAFTKKGGFSAPLFREMLAQPEVAANRATCLFVAAPDVLRVLEDGTVIGDAAATLAQFPEWAREIRALGLPVALVAQNGLEDMLHLVPWDLVDVLFLGGSTEWKLGAGAEECVRGAKAQGKRTHMGRVNSYKRLKLADNWGVDTADGTFLAFGPRTNLPRLLNWLDKLAPKGSPCTPVSTSVAESTDCLTPMPAIGEQPLASASLDVSRSSIPCPVTTAGVSSPTCQRSLRVTCETSQSVSTSSSTHSAPRGVLPWRSHSPLREHPIAW